MIEVLLKFILTEIDLVMVMAAPALIVSVAFLLLLYLVPEARAFIKLKFTKGGIMINSSNASGVVSHNVAKIKSSGILMSGKDKFGKRKTYQIPDVDNPVISKRFVLKGVGKPIFFNYDGKVALGTPETLAAIEVAEKTIKDRKKLPNGIRKWAEEQKIPSLKLEEIVNKYKDEKGETVEVKTKEERWGSLKKLFLLDPRNLARYFSEYYNELQIDVLLQQKEEQGYRRGKKGKSSMDAILMLIVGAVMGAMVMLIVAMLGILPI